MTAAYGILPRAIRLLSLAPLLCMLPVNAAAGPCPQMRCLDGEDGSGSPLRLAAELGFGSGHKSTGFSRSRGRAASGRSAPRRSRPGAARRPAFTTSGTKAVPRVIAPEEPQIPDEPGSPPAEGLVKKYPPQRHKRQNDIYRCRSGDCFTRRPWRRHRHPGRGAFYHYPERYAYYACDDDLTRVYSGVGGLRVYSCDSTPVATAAVVATAAAVAHSAVTIEPESAQVGIRSSPVVLYLMPPDGIVYETSYPPKAHYSHRAGERFFWVPGVRLPTLDSSRYALAAAEGATPAGNATVISYRSGETVVFLSSEPPYRDTYSVPHDGLFAWLPGVVAPTGRQHETIDQALSLHRLKGAQAIESAVREQRFEKSPALFR